MYYPSSLDEVIGIPKIKEQVAIAVEAAKIKGKTVDHILAAGPPGTGKTMLGHIISKMMDSPLIEKVGNALNVSATLMELPPNAVLFIDEIHRLKETEEEKMYSPMLDFTYLDNNGLYSYPIPLFPFTLVGATTRMGDLSKPLIDRFPISLRFPLYTEEEVIQIITQAAKKTIDIEITKDAITAIAKVSRETPRIALTLLGRIHDLALSMRAEKITQTMVESMLSLMNIKDDGLTEEDHKYMWLLFRANRPIGVSAIAQTIGTDAKTVSQFIEPFLLRHQYIAITGNGRILLPKALEIVRSVYLAAK